MKREWRPSDTMIAAMVWVCFLLPCWFIVNKVFVESLRWSFVFGLASSLIVAVIVTQNIRKV